MEILAESVAMSCPSAFSQPATDMFLRAVTAVVAAHCSFIKSEYQWPKDDADAIFGKTNEEMSYDFIVVGAGTAGSLLASHLSNLRPTWNVLLVEAGDDPDPIYEVPSFVFNNLCGQKRSDWSYKTEPSNNYCLGYENNSSSWNKGKAMGGSSSINAMLYVRGHAEDFNNWAAIGNVGWNYKELLPYFESIEKNLNLNEYEYPKNPWYDVLTLSWNEMGYKPYKNDRNEGLLGTTLLRTLVRKGKRLNTAKIYLSEAKNLHILKNSHVERLISDINNKKILGVEIRYKNDMKLKIKANKEVILSAGSIATPQILMLSGFGPKKHLNDMNIRTIENLKVGKNLQDHLTMPLILAVNQKTIIRPEKFVSFLLEYMLTRNGPIGTLGTFDCTNFVNTENVTNYPNIQFFNSYYTMNDNFALKSYLEAIGLRKNIADKIIEFNKQSDLVFIHPSLLHPKSTGEILLNKTNPTGDPVIVPNYLKDENDMKTMLKAIELVQKLEETKTLQSLNMEIIDIKLEDCAPFPFKTHKYWECYVKHMASSVYHPVGTAKMGPKKDGSVVNYKLLVHGMKNLRVVDASIMPTIPGSNIMGATLMIAEKGADIIRKKYSKNEL